MKRQKGISHKRETTSQKLAVVGGEPKAL